VLTPVLIEELASFDASFAVLGSTPRSLSQPATVFFAPESWELTSLLWLVIPATITNTTPAPSATSETSTSAALRPRGAR